MPKKPFGGKAKKAQLQAKRLRKEVGQMLRFFFIKFITLITITFIDRKHFWCKKVGQVVKTRLLLNVRN